MVSDYFKETIKKYLDARSQEDALFAETYSKEGKSLDECCNYILQQVKASGRNGFTDDEIFGIAVHYYDEDDLGKIADLKCQVVVNHEIELSEEEKTELREKAKDDFYKQMLEEQRAINRKPKTKKQEVSGPSLFSDL